MAPSFFPSEASFPLSLPLHPLSVSLPPLYLRLSPSVLSIPLSLAEHAARVNAPSLTSARAVDQLIYSAYLPTHLPTYRHLFTVAQGARPAPRIGGIAGCTRATCFRKRAPPSRVARSMMRLDSPGPERFYDNSCVPIRGTGGILGSVIQLESIRKKAVARAERRGGGEGTGGVYPERSPGGARTEGGLFFCLPGRRIRYYQSIRAERLSMYRSYRTSMNLDFRFALVADLDPACLFFSFLFNWRISASARSAKL